MSATRKSPSRIASSTKVRDAIALALGLCASSSVYADYYDSVTVVGTKDQPTQLASPKYTASLRDTPQTITVLSHEVIEDQGLLTLREVLSTVPGITFGAGEGGGGYGDSINLRGFSGSNDITIDGMRDSAQYTLAIARTGQITVVEQGENTHAPTVKKTSDPWGD